MQNNKANSTVETTVANENFTAMPYSVITTLVDRTGKIVAKSAEEIFSGNVNEEKISKQTLSLNMPKLWSLENPYSYRIVVEIKQSGQIIDKKSIKFEIRTVEIKPNGLFLNGNYTKLYGTNNHQDHAGR